MLGFFSVGSAPVSSLQISSGSSGIVTVSKLDIDITTYDTAINTGATVQVDNGTGVLIGSEFSSAFGSEFSRLVKIKVAFTTFPAKVGAAVGVMPTAGAVTITTNNANIQVGRSVLATRGNITITPQPFLVRNSAFVFPTAGSVTITSGLHHIGETANVFANCPQITIFPLSTVVDVPPYIYPATRAITITTKAARVKVGRNPKIPTETQKFAPENLVTLFELDTTALGGEYMRFTSSATETSAVSFGGNIYTPVPIEATGFEFSGKGTPPTPTLRVLNTPTIQSGVIALSDMLGATLYRIRTFRQFLDDGADPDPNAKFPVDIYKLERKVSQNKVYIEWELSASIDQEGRMIPARQIIKDYCTHIYRVWNPETNAFDYTKATCPFAGAGCFDQNDRPTGAAGDVCGKRLSSCKKRFGNNAELPTRAFPGVAEVR